jgi:hypothetical protein
VGDRRKCCTALQVGRWPMVECCTVLLRNLFHTPVGWRCGVSPENAYERPKTKKTRTSSVTMRFRPIKPGFFEWADFESVHFGVRNQTRVSSRPSNQRSGEPRYPATESAAYSTTPLLLKPLAVNGSTAGGLPRRAFHVPPSGSGRKRSALGVPGTEGHGQTLRPLPWPWPRPIDASWSTEALPTARQRHAEWEGSNAGPASPGVWNSAQPGRTP